MSENNQKWVCPECEHEYDQPPVEGKVCSLCVEERAREPVWYYAYYRHPSDNDSGWDGGFSERTQAVDLAGSYMETDDAEELEVGIVTLGFLIEGGTPLWEYITQDNTMILNKVDDYNTIDPTGRYIHEPLWVEFLLEEGINPLFEYQGIRWFPVDVIGGRWADTLDPGTEFIGYSYSSERGPSGHYYGLLATGDPRSGGDPGKVSHCTQLEEGTGLGLVDCLLTDDTRFIGRVIGKDVVTEDGETNTYYEVEVDYDRSVSTREEIDIHSRRPGIVGVNDFEVCRVLNELPSAELIRRIRYMGEDVGKITIEMNLVLTVEDQLIDYLKGLYEVEGEAFDLFDALNQHVTEQITGIMALDVAPGTKVHHYYINRIRRGE